MRSIHVKDDCDDLAALVIALDLNPTRVHGVRSRVRGIFRLDLDNSAEVARIRERITQITGITEVKIVQPNEAERRSPVPPDSFAFQDAPYLPGRPTELNTVPSLLADCGNFKTGSCI